MSARTLAAALRLGCIDELEPGFSRGGPIAIATPTGRLRGEISARYASVWDGGFEAAFARRRRRPVGPAIARGLSAARRAFSVLFSAGAGGSLAAWPCGFVFRGVRGPRRGRAMGEAGVLADLWGSCGSDDAGAWAGTLPCVEDQSGVDGLSGRLPRTAAHLVALRAWYSQRTRPIATKTCR